MSSSIVPDPEPVEAVLSDSGDYPVSRFVRGLRSRGRMTGWPGHWHR